MEYNESAVIAAGQNLYALEQLVESIGQNAPDLNFALESEVIMGNNSILANHFGNQSSEARRVAAIESITEAIGNAFKAFIERLVEALKKMIAWLTDKAMTGKNALKETVIRGYDALPSLNYRLSWKLTVINSGNPAAKELVERWQDRISPWKLDLVSQGKCMKALEEVVRRFKTENILGTFKKYFSEVRAWEDKAFDEAIDLDTALIRKTRDEAEASRTAFKEKIAADLDAASEDIQDFGTYISGMPEEVKECWENADDTPNTSVATLQFTETTVLTAMRAISVEEFSRMRKDQANTLSDIVKTLDHVNQETAKGEYVLQHCVQAMRSAYTKRLTWIMNCSTGIQGVFSLIASAFRAMLEVELAYLHFTIERVKMEITGSSAEEWKEDYDALNKRKEGLENVLTML